MKKVYIVGAKRSAVGSFSGSLATVHPSEFGATVLKEAMNHANVKPEMVNEVVVGNILSAGLGQGIGRQIQIKAGIPQSVPGLSLNMLCGSGLKTVINAYTTIQAGFSNVIAAGGVESMSGAPYLVNSNVRNGVKMGDQVMKDHMIHDALTDAFDGIHMGITAENIAEKHSISREAQDAFAIKSQEKAIKAQDSGRFNDEIVPIIIKTRKGEVVFNQDEYVNRTTSLEKLSTLRPAFKKDGTVTAGNASGINDGASFVIVASEDVVKENNLSPLVEIVGVGQAGVDPKVMGLGPVPAISNALKNANLTLKDIDLFELNEAFAAQALGVVKELAVEHGVTEEDIMSKTNLNGGAIAIGHPVGASGNRILVTLIHEMLKQPNVKYGLASLCIGGGMGVAVIVKKI
ncbi:MAG TPA: acetyl-CoA C-acetyltransferase [Acholeplasma sp.]|nr:acetyl-CoA C-acetyltransferase [Acholeplasma sp.]